MSKFNQNKSGEEKNVAEQIREELTTRPDATTNYEGALAFKLDSLTELYLMAASTLVGEKKYYTSAEESDRNLLRSIENVARIDPEFILQLAVYCREQLHLRSVPLMLITEFANSDYCTGKVSYARRYVSRCIQRADELTELIAYQLMRNKVVPRAKTKLPMLIRFGVKEAFSKFDGYQLAKYDSDKKIVKMRDSMFLTNPKPTQIIGGQQEIFKKLADRTLESPETWEVMRSSGKMNWHQVINNIFYKNNRVNNYMAILRNLRNCMTDKSVTQEDIGLLCKMISDKNAVLYSKQLPFRFFAVYRELYKASGTNFTPAGALMVTEVMDAIETAVEYSVDNFPKLSGSSTVVACDVSGSMKTVISKNSSIERFDIGIMLGMMANRFAGHTITGMFGDTWKVVPMSRSNGILKNTLEMHSREGEVGYSTNGYKVIDYLLENDIKVDRILIFTDCQMWNSHIRYSWDNNDNVTFADRFLLYQRRYPGAKLYAWDLSGYGNVMIPPKTRGVCLMGGWNDKIFDFISAFEETGEGNVAIKKIKAIKP